MKTWDMLRSVRVLLNVGPVTVYGRPECWPFVYGTYRDVTKIPTLSESGRIKSNLDVASDCERDTIVFSPLFLNLSPVKLGHQHAKESRLQI